MVHHRDPQPAGPLRWAVRTATAITVAGAPILATWVVTARPALHIVLAAAVGALTAGSAMGAALGHINRKGAKQ